MAKKAPEKGYNLKKGCKTLIQIIPKTKSQIYTPIIFFDLSQAQNKEKLFDPKKKR